MLLFGISPILDIHAKLKAVDEQAEDEVMQLRGLRETDCSSGQALDSRAQRQMFAFQLLCIPFPHFMARGIQMSLVRSPAISIKARNPKRHEQGFQLQKRLIFPPPKHIGQDSRAVI